MTILDVKKLLSYAPDDALFEYIEPEKSTSTPYLIVTQTKKVDIDNDGKTASNDSVYVRLYG